MTRGGRTKTLFSALGTLALAAASLAWRQADLQRTRPKLPPAMPTAAITARVDALFSDHWAKQGVSSAGEVDDLRVARRLSLSLCGTIPSLAEQRLLASWPADERISRYVDHLLADPRSHFYLAERLARATNSSAAAEPFFIYRRRRYVFWLAEQIGKRRPYDEIVRDCLAGEGVWTDHPGVNYITGHDIDPVKLAGRTTRAFLGLRLDCAQCHDHPFAKWKQKDFESFAAWFSNAKLSWRGVMDDPSPTLVEDSATKKKKIVEPAVPFQPELLPTEGTLRQRFAGWATHRENRMFARATVNRLWTLMLGRGLVEPVDQLENDEATPGVLSALAGDLRDHDFDLQRTIRTIAGLRVFRLQSAFDGPVREDQEAVFAAFPLVRLRPEQAAGSVVQSSRLFTIDDRASALLQVFALGAQNDFVERYGDYLEEELTPHDGNVAQRLLLMNGEVVGKQIEAEMATASHHASKLAPDAATAVRTAFEVVLTRAPTAAESDYFRRLLDAQMDRTSAMEDLFWSLLNSSEFSWNH